MLSTRFSSCLFCGGGQLAVPYNVLRIWPYPQVANQVTQEWQLALSQGTLFFELEASRLDAMQHFVQAMGVFFHCGPVHQYAIHESLHALQAFQSFQHFMLKGFRSACVPKGNLLKQYLPNGVMNVVCLQLSGRRGIGQNPLAALRDENTMASLSLEVVSLEIGRM